TETTPAETTPAPTPTPAPTLEETTPTVQVPAGATYDLGEFQIRSGTWQHGWHTDGVDEKESPLQMSTLAKARYIVVELADELDSNFELILQGDGNHWAWSQKKMFDMDDDIRTIVIDLNDHNDWAAIKGGDSAKVILGVNNLSDVISRAYLVGDF
ncbi:MAG: hypothetical protein FWD19_05210, partial [Defluviitaleaceae bacterium]|nr:hypothetical protein [Defluviitaleaceae bacterium]